MAAFGAGHARSDRCEDEDTFQSLAKDKNPDVEKRHSRAGVGPRRIGRAVRSNSLPHKHGRDAKRSHNNADAQSWPHVGSKSITAIMDLLPIDCFFLAADCEPSSALTKRLP
jgi:hypothetical protein